MEPSASVCPEYLGSPFMSPLMSPPMSPPIDRVPRNSSETNWPVNWRPTQSYAPSTNKNRSLESLIDDFDHLHHLTCVQSPKPAGLSPKISRPLASPAPIKSATRRQRASTDLHDKGFTWCQHRSINKELERLTRSGSFPRFIPDIPVQNVEDDLEYDDEDGSEVDESAVDVNNEKKTAEIRAEKRKMRRFRLTHSQTRFLQSEFARQAHPDVAQRARLSKEIPGLSPRQVQVWFQNRRAKLKRLPNDDRERILQSTALPKDFHNSKVPPHSTLVKSLGYDGVLPTTNSPSTAVGDTLYNFERPSEIKFLLSPRCMESTFGDVYKPFIPGQGFFNDPDIVYTTWNPSYQSRSISPTYQTQPRSPNFEVDSQLKRPQVRTWSYSADYNPPTTEHTSNRISGTNTKLLSASDVSFPSFSQVFSGPQNLPDPQPSSDMPSTGEWDQWTSPVDSKMLKRSPDLAMTSDQHGPNPNPQLLLLDNFGLQSADPYQTTPLPLGSYEDHSQTSQFVPVGPAQDCQTVSTPISPCPLSFGNEPSTFE